MIKIKNKKSQEASTFLMAGAIFAIVIIMVLVYIVPLTFFYSWKEKPVLIVESEKGNLIETQNLIYIIKDHLKNTQQEVCNPLSEEIKNDVKITFFEKGEIKEVNLRTLKKC